MPGSHAVAVAGAGSGRVALVGAVFRPFEAKPAAQHLNFSFAHGPQRRSSHLRRHVGHACCHSLLCCRDLHWRLAVHCAAARAFAPTTGYASDETDDKIQESIFVVGYRTFSTSSVRWRKHMEK